MLRYSKLTDTQKQALVDAYYRAASMATDTLHAVAIAASDSLGHNGTARGSDIQADRFAVALTYLVFSGHVRLENDTRPALAGIDAIEKIRIDSGCSTVEAINRYERVNK
jgi:hypothetical protein